MMDDYEIVQRIVTLFLVFFRCQISKFHCLIFHITRVIFAERKCAECTIVGLSRIGYIIRHVAYLFGISDILFPLNLV